MFNPEMGPQEPEETEKEQTPEEILSVINEAIEKGREVLLTQSGSEKSITNIAIPFSIEGSFLTVEADGYGFEINVDSIRRAELIEEENKEE